MQTQNKTIETIFFMAIAIEQSDNDSDLIENLKWAVEQEFKKWPTEELLITIDEYLAQKKCPHYKERIYQYLPLEHDAPASFDFDLSTKDKILEAMASVNRVIATDKQNFINEIR